MRQLRLVALLLCVLGVLTTASFAQGTPEKAVAKEKAAKKKPPAHWVKLEDGVEVLRLFDADVGPTWPEIAVLRLSEAKYEEFRKDETEFVNSRHVFSKDTRSVMGLSRPNRAKAKKGKADDWYVTLDHDITSDTLYVSDQIM